MNVERRYEEIREDFLEEVPWIPINSQVVRSEVSLGETQESFFTSHISCCFLQTPGTPAMPSPSPFPK